MVSSETYLPPSPHHIRAPRQDPSDISIPNPQRKTSELPDSIVKASKQKCIEQERNAITTVPLEVLQQIYRQLHPKDFNAARRTCARWMLCSLDVSLLTLMLKRGGWWSGVEAELRHAKRSRYRPEAWFLSRRLSRECALSAGWTGNGVDDPDTRNGFPKVLFESTHVDFGDLATGYPGAGGTQSGGLVFTVSVCGRFLLVADGGIIYVYELLGNELTARTVVVCPRRVLAMSMDASGGRYAVAALLDGRMGIVCTLDQSLGVEERAKDDDGDSLSTAHLYIQNVSSTVGDPQERFPRLSISCPLLANSDLQPSITNSRPSSPVFTHLEIQSASDIIGLRGCDDPQRRSRNFINSEWSPLDFISSRRKTLPSRSPSADSTTPSSPGQIPIDAGHRTIYRNLCCTEDPPRSVAICPQRQCVAFGCSSGLELHWTDAASHQDLTRWFPLSGPSDYLYFLSPRTGIDTARKLRLISSAGSPADSPAISRKFYRQRPVLSTLWASAGFEGLDATTGFAGWVGECDHYHAVPLADGFHVLFCDPESGLVCLGGDAPVGDPRRLHRKVLCVPPGELGRKGFARVFAAGKEVRGGVRVVAVYGDAIVLYTIPSDVFKLSKREQQKDCQLQRLSDEDIANEEWISWWSNDAVPPNWPKIKDTRGGPKSVWPLFIKGTTIGTLEGVVDVAVSNAEELYIWAFALDGKAVAWQVRRRHLTERRIAQDGRVLSMWSLDGDGDIIMAEAVDVDRFVHRNNTNPVYRAIEDLFAGIGSTRLPGALALENDNDVDLVQIYGTAMFDEDGDIVMTDAPAES